MKPYFEEDGITIYHGDCREVLPTIPTVDTCWPYANLLLTDPPYGVNLGNHGASREGRADHVLVKQGYASYDDTIDNLRQIVVPAIRSALTLVIRGIVFCAGQHICEFPKPAVIGGIYFPAAQGRNVWGFTSLATAMLYGPGCRVELGSRATICESTEAAEVNGHPCPKPLKSMKFFVALGSEAGDTILDPFMGSGTTLRAAKDLGRKAIGIEIEEKYCEIAAQRLNQKVFAF